MSTWTLGVTGLQAPGQFRRSSTTGLPGGAETTSEDVTKEGLRRHPGIDKAVELVGGYPSELDVLTGVQLRRCEIAVDLDQVIDLATSLAVVASPVHLPQLRENAAQPPACFLFDLATQSFEWRLADPYVSAGNIPAARKQDAVVTSSQHQGAPAADDDGADDEQGHTESLEAWNVTSHRKRPCRPLSPTNVDPVHLGRAVPAPVHPLIPDGCDQKERDR